MIEIIAASVLCLILARAVMHKLTSRAEFQSALSDYRLLPESWIRWTSTALIVAEIIAVGAIVLPPSRQTGAAFAALLLAAYAAAISINLLRGHSRIDCGCGGASQALSWWLVFRNSLFITACVFVAMSNEARALTMTQVFAAAGCVIALWLSLLVFEQLLANRHHARETSFSGSY